MTAFLIFLLCVFVSLGEQFDFGKFKVVSDLLPEECFTEEKMYLEADEDTGLPKCIDFDSKSSGSCAKFRNPDPHKTVVSKPTCDKDGQFGPVQCKGERTTGRCFCYDSEGKRLFGQEWRKDANSMTCACSRRKSEMKSKENIYFNSLHCNSKGSYESLQCDVVSEQCWCVDEKTGDLTSPVVPDKAMVKLPCYKSPTVGTQYLRQCESKKYAQNRILHHLKLHGTSDGTFGELICDDDGAYGTYTVVDGSAYCTWKDNSYLGTWQYTGSDRSTTLNCNCARDSRIFANAGKSQTQTCSGSGNYQSYQVSNGVPYCVDSDGYKKNTAELKTEEECDNFLAY